MPDCDGRAEDALTLLDWVEQYGELYCVICEKVVDTKFLLDHPAHYIFSPRAFTKPYAICPSCGD